MKEIDGIDWEDGSPPTQEQINKLFENYECPCCEGELSDAYNPTMNVNWLKCENCDFVYRYE